MNKPNILFCCFAIFLFLLSVEAKQNDEVNLNILPEWGVSSLDLPTEVFFKKNPDFHIIMKGKGNDSLAINNKPNDFWEVSLCYIKHNKIDAIVFCFVDKKLKTKSKSIIVLYHLLQTLGDNFNLSITRLDSAIVKNTLGYSFYWKKNDANILLKIGPFEYLQEDNFQLQLIIFSKDEKSPFIPHKFASGKSKDLIIRKILNNYRECCPQKRELQYLEEKMNQ